MGDRPDHRGAVSRQGVDMGERQHHRGDRRGRDSGDAAGKAPHMETLLWPYGAKKPLKPSESQRQGRVSPSRCPARRGSLTPPRARVRRALPSRKKPSGTRQPAPATTATSDQPGCRRRAPGTARRTAQFLLSRGRVTGRLMSRTIRRSARSPDIPHIWRTGASAKAPDVRHRAPWSSWTARTISAATCGTTTSARTAPAS